MNILILGQGGREHAIAWKVNQSSKVTKIYVAPGNAGMESIAERVSLALDNSQEILEFVESKNVDLTIVGPEAPLVDGIVDDFAKQGKAIFGPNKFASQLEGSKAFAKELMKKLNIPTAEYQEFTDMDQATQYLKQASYPIVVKADGLAAGKGVTIAQSYEEAELAIQKSMKDKVFGDAGIKVIIEEWLDGEEASIIAISDGETVYSLTSSQDHKRIHDADQGPNTGGMGAYSPAPVVTSQVNQEALDRIFAPLVKELKDQGYPFVGFIYAGVMLTEKGIKVLEFNVRLGDPEAQVILPSLENDLVDVFQACVEGKLSGLTLRWKNLSAVTVVLTSEGYPGSYRKGDTIHGISDAEKMTNVVVFHAGTKREGEEFVTSGGRVLNVVSMGSDLPQAVDSVYSAVQKISFKGMHYRKDIAYRALARISN